MTSSQPYDLIIVGGGPAGATAGLYAHRAGLRALVLEKERFPRDKICGDAISGKSVAILHDLGLLEKVRQLPGAVLGSVLFGSPSHTDLAVDLKRYDYVDRLTNQVIPMECFVIRRHIFDHFLFTEMRAAGVEAEEGFQVKELLYDSGAVVGVRGRAGNGEIAEYRAPLVLGCDGFNSIVSRQAGLYKHESRHWLVALRCYYENVAGMDDQIELHYLREVEPGYFWIFPLENGYANVGIGMVHKFLKKRRVDLKQALADVVSSPAFRDRFADARPLEEPVGWNLPAGSKRRTVHADGVMLLGDAASLIDPFTGEGIGNALYSARTAVETAVAASEAGDYSARFLKCYGNRLWDALGDELKISTRMQQLARRKSLLNLVIDRAAGDPEMEELFSGMIANALPKRRFVNPLFYLKLLFR